MDGEGWREGVPGCRWPAPAWAKSVATGRACVYDHKTCVCVCNFEFGGYHTFYFKLKYVYVSSKLVGFRPELVAPPSGSLALLVKLSLQAPTFSLYSTSLKVVIYMYTAL